METVPKKLECPECGENRVDILEISDDDYVTCLTCGNVYDVFFVADEK